MGEKACCGFGHREIFSDISGILYQTIIRMISQYSVSVFYTGGDGEFDKLFATGVRRAKRLYPHVKLYLIKPYMLHSLNRDKEFYRAMYDDIIIPQEIMGCHYKNAITQRNYWMISKSDYVISYITRDFGGAYNALRFAKKTDKIIFSVNPPNK